MTFRLAAILLHLITIPAFADTITDDTGRHIELTTPAERIVALSPHTAEMLLAVGAARQLIAAPPSSHSLPAHVQALRTFGGIDREAFLELEPDLVIAWASGNRATDLRWLEQQGITVYRSEPANLQSIADNLIDLGQLTGSPQQGALAAERFLSEIRKTCESGKLKQTYVEIWQNPALTLGGQHWLNDVLRHAGLRNVFSSIDRGVFPLEKEAHMQQSALLTVSLQTARTPTEGVINADGLSRPGPGLAKSLARLCTNLKKGLKTQ